MPPPTWQGVLEGSRTYSVSIIDHAPAAAATDLWTLRGSASATLRLLRLLVTGRATAATWYRLRLLKYSSFLTGGTAVVVAPVSLDSGDVAATGVTQTWGGGLPTPGTLVGPVRDDYLPLQAVALTATQPFTGPPGLLYDFGLRRGPVLRGIAQYFALNGAGVALPPGTVLDITAEFSEE